MIYPKVDVFSADWLDKMSSLYGVSIIIVYIAPEDWDNVLTPWTATGVPKGSQPFEGDASEFYKTLREIIIPKVENTFSLTNISQRDLIGVSLAGLFTLWQWMQFDAFTSIGCLSGSFWYSGFLDWFENRNIPQKVGKAYFLLGIEEPKAKVKEYQSVGVNTEAIVKRLEAEGIECRFDWVTGNHFSNPAQRAEKALEYLLNTSK